MATQGCPCGFLGHPRKPCRCTPRQVRLYRNRLSGPLLDRIDMHVEVPVVTARELTRGVRRKRSTASDLFRSPESGSLAGDAEPESSASVRARVIAAEVQERGSRRQGGRGLQASERGPIHCNAQMGIHEIERHCRVDDATRALLHKAMETRSMSARGVHRVLRVARTIADLAGEGEVALEQVAEAVQYQAIEPSATLADRTGRSV